MRRALALLLVACSTPTKAPEPITPPPEPPVTTAGQQPVAARLAPPVSRSFQFREDLPETAGTTVDRPDAPLSLTASDGTGLKLVALDARAVVEDPLAFTELRMTFENPEDRVLEGTFRVRLPEGASISRFAMAIDGRWQEGEVVELQAARRAYEDFLHRKQDPALLEQAGGNEFSARVFPIPARGKKELILSYSQDRPSSEAGFTIPLAGLPELGTLDVRARVNGTLVEEHRTKFVPAKDFAVPQVVARKGVRSGDAAIVRVKPAIETDPDEITSLALLVDTSASRALGFDRQVALIDALIGAMKQGAAAEAPLLVVAFDQDLETIYEGTARGWDDVARKKLAERRALGASDPVSALGWLAKKGGYDRIVLVGDGVVTAGATDGEALRKAVRATGARRLDAVALGGIRDADTLGRMVTAGLAQRGMVIDGDDGAQEIARRLTRRVSEELVVSVEGATWFWPKQLPPMQPGDEALVHVEAPAGAAITIKLGDAKLDVPADALASADPLLVSRSVARARIAALTEERERVPATNTAKRAALRDKITRLSTEKRVLSPFTALLVLETEDDYARFGIDRKALADILTIGEQGVTVHRRTAPVVAKRPEKLGKEDDAKKMKSKDTGAGGDPMDIGVEEDFDGAFDDVELMEGEVGGAEGGEVGGVLGGAANGVETARGMSAPESIIAEPRMEQKVEAEPRPVTVDRAPSPRAAEPPAPPPAPAPPPREERTLEEGRMSRAPSRDVDDGNEDTKKRRKPAYTGELAEVMNLLARKKGEDALALARAWRAEDPGDVLALVALGEALEKLGDKTTAARAYGSLIDLFPGRADLRRFAGQRLERIGGATALELAADTYAKAVEQRPDHPASHRLLAFARVKQGRLREAFDVLDKAIDVEYPDGRFAGVDRILREDLALVGAAWMRAVPRSREKILSRLAAAGATPEDQPSLRFVLLWETDANDVDFHITDGEGNRAWYQNKHLATGGELYADVTTGYGPECFTIRGDAAGRAYPYKLEAHYYSRGPMGYGMGKLQIIEHDGKGKLRFEERPFVIMQDDAFIDLGTVRRK